jgi:hypothetical protein
MRKRQYGQMKKHCRHRHQEVITTGGYHFSHVLGVWDDIREYLVCFDCGMKLERGWRNWKERVRDYYSLPEPPSAESEEVPF